TTMMKNREETMKTHILLALVGLATGFVLPTFAQDTADPKTAQQIHALAAKFNEVFNKHDPAAVAALYTEDAVWRRTTEHFTDGSALKECMQTGVLSVGT